MENFVYIVPIIAFIYIFITRFLQNKLIDKELMKKVQEESKKINAEMKSTNDLDLVMKKQQKLMEDMNKMMFSQMKYMVVVLVVFFLFSSFLNYINPFLKDDFKVNMTKINSNYAFLNYKIETNRSGMWKVKVETKDGFAEKTFYVNTNKEEPEYDAHKGDLFVDINKKFVHSGDYIEINTVSKNPEDNFVAVFNNGTSFYVELPFTIPFLNVKRIYGPTGWFIFSSIVISFLINPIISFIDKSKK